MLSAYSISTLNIVGGSQPTDGWRYSDTITLTSTKTLQTFVIPFVEGMKEDYTDVRFVVNKDGNSVQKLWLPFGISSSDENSATFEVGYLRRPQIGDTVSVLWGNENAENVSSLRNAYGAAGWYYQNFDQPINFAVNKYLGPDFNLHDDESYQHAPSPHENPVTGMDAVTWKRAELANEHGASEGSKIMFQREIGEDSYGNPTYSVPVVAFDHTRELFPGISATVTSVTNNGGVARFNHSGGMIYTVGAYLNNTGFSVPGYNGDFLISASGSGYYEVTTMKVDGETPITYVSDSTGSSQAVIFQVGINNNFMWTSETTGIILVDVNLIGSNTASYTSVGLRRVKRIDVTNIDSTPQFSEPVLVGDDVYSAMSESHYIARNGWMFWMGHGISRQDLTYPVLIFYSTDNGVTINLLTIPSPSGAQLNESTCVQIANADRTYQNKLFYIIRNEAAGQNYRFYNMIVTMEDDGTLSHTTPVMGDLWDATSQSCPEQTGFAMGHGRYERITFMYGDTHIFGYYIENDGTLGTDQMAWKHIGYPGTANQAIMNGSALSCGRPQPKPIDKGNQMARIYWCRNMRSGSPELSSDYLQYFDVSMMSLKTADSTTLTPSRPRPTLTDGVMKFGELYSGYRHFSTTTISMPTLHPTLIDVPLIGTGDILFQIGDPIVVNALTNRYFYGNVDSVNGRTVRVSTEGHVGSGSSSSWKINLGKANSTGNLLSNQMLNTRFFMNPNTEEGILFQGRARGTGSTLYTIGGKKDETESVSTVTFTNGGEGRVVMKGLTFTPTIGLMADTQYNNLPALDSSATIQDHVTRFADSISWYGVAHEVSRTSSSVTFRFPKGYGTSGNSKTPTLILTGTVSANASVSSGGSTAEATSSYANVVAATALGVMHIKNADTFNTTYSPGTGFGNFEFDINSSRAIAKYNGNTVLTKLPSNNNGIPNYNMALAIGLSTTLTQPDSLIEFEYMLARPGDTTTVTTSGNIVPGTWTERSDGEGLN